MFNSLQIYKFISLLVAQERVFLEVMLSSKVENAKAGDE